MMSDTEGYEEEHVENQDDARWPVWAKLLATIATVIVLAGVGLTCYAIYAGFERGEEKREAQNQTRIERERIFQDALRQYRDDR